MIRQLVLGDVVVQRAVLYVLVRLAATQIVHLGPASPSSVVRREGEEGREETLLTGSSVCKDLLSVLSVIFLAPVDKLLLVTRRGL